MTRSRPSSLPIIKISGATPKKRGVEIGTKARELIRENRDYYFRSWEKYGSMNRRSVFRLMQGFIRNVRAWDPSIFEEIEGIAEGAELDLEEVFAINARYELVISRMGRAKPNAKVRDGCTAIAVTDEATADNETLHAQNWDYRHLEGCIVIEENQGEGRASIVGITEAGRMGVLGFNSGGIGLTVNGLVSDLDTADNGIPFWLLVRAANNSSTLESAIGNIIQSPRSVSGSIILSHEDGYAVGIEFTPKDAGILYPQKGVMVHTNHFVAMEKTVNDLFKASVPDTIMRFYTASKMLSGKKVGLEDVKRTLSDHFEYPLSICKHLPSGADPDQSFETISSMIFNLRRRELVFSLGNPCKAAYQTMRFDSLKGQRHNSRASKAA